MSTVTVKSRDDEAYISDEIIQEALKAYIEQVSGRKVKGEVWFDTTRANRISSERTEFYTAHCTLQPESKP